MDMGRVGCLLQLTFLTWGAGMQWILLGFISHEDYEKLPKWANGEIFDYTP
jgi:hypothetical protein